MRTIQRNFQNLFSLFIGGLIIFYGFYSVLTEQGRSNIEGNILSQLFATVIFVVSVGGIVVLFQLIVLRQSKSNPIFVILAVVIAIGISIYFLWARGFITFIPFGNNLNEYITIKGIRSSSGAPYIAGKAITVNKSAKTFDNLYFSLPEELRATSPEEVTTIIWLECVELKTGSYTTGAKGYSTDCTVTLIDKKQSLYLDRQAFKGVRPPRTKPASGDWHGARPIKLIVDYIIALPRN